MPFKKVKEKLCVLLDLLPYWLISQHFRGSSKYILHLLTIYDFSVKKEIVFLLLYPVKLIITCNKKITNILNKEVYIHGYYADRFDHLVHHCSPGWSYWRNDS